MPYNKGFILKTKNMEELKFTEQGPVLVKTLNVSNVEFTEPKEDDLLPAFKDTLIYALNKRANYCMKELQDNSSRIRSYNTSSIEYVKEDKTRVFFNYPSYQAMLDAVKLIKADEYDKLTALMFDQICKALYFVKPVNKAPFSFNNLISCVHELAYIKHQELVLK